jgi:hypothetical protein
MDSDRKGVRNRNVMAFTPAPDVEKLLRDIAAREDLPMSRVLDRLVRKGAAYEERSAA